MAFKVFLRGIAAGENGGLLRQSTPLGQYTAPACRSVPPVRQRNAQEECQCQSGFFCIAPDAAAVRLASRTSSTADTAPRPIPGRAAAEEEPSFAAGADALLGRRAPSARLRETDSSRRATDVLATLLRATSLDIAEMVAV